MTINYCSWPIGDDLTGDGSPGNPYKTITKSSEGIVGGDEVRVEKSLDPTSLPGTIAWVQGNHTFTTSSDLSGLLSQGDFISKGIGWPWGETLYEVNNVGVDFVEIYATYPGTTETKQSYKIETTDTDSDPTSAEPVQEIMSAGAMVNPIIVSGGWDLATETQTGHTYFRQVHSTFSNRYGYGLKHTGKYVEISALSFVRYRYGVYFYNISDTYFTGAHLNSNGSYGIYLRGQITINQVLCVGNFSYNAYFYGAEDSSFGNFRTLSGKGAGIYLYSCYRNSFVSYKAEYNDSYGLYMRYCENINFTSLSVINNGNHGIYSYYNNANRFTSINILNNNRGIYFNRSSENIFADAQINDNNTGVYSFQSYNNRLYNVTMSGNTSDFYIYGKGKPEIPVFSIGRFQEDNFDVWYFDDGHCETCRTSGFFLDVESIKFHSTSTSAYIYHSWFAKVCKGQSRTLFIYMRDDEIHHPIVYGTLYFKEKAVSSAVLFDVSGPGWHKFEIMPISGDLIIDDGELELRIQVTGDCDCWADKFSEYTSEDLMAEIVSHREATEDKIDRVLTATEIRQVTVVGPAGSVTEFITDLTEPIDGFWDRGALVFTSGENKGIMRKIQSYYGVDFRIKVRTALPFVPGVGDTFIIVPARAFRLNYADINDLVDAVYDEDQADHTELDSFGEGFNDIIADVPLVKAKTDLLTFDLNDNVHSVPKDVGVLESDFNRIYDELIATEYGLHALMTLLLDIDTSDELDVRFLELKGDGWVDETLKAIKDAIDDMDSRDWDETELADIRGALGIVGAKTTPADGQLQEIKDKTDLLPPAPADQLLVEAAIVVAEGNVRGVENDDLDTISDQIDTVALKTDKLKFAGDDDVIATINGERVNLTDPTEAKLDDILLDTAEIEAVKEKTDKLRFTAGDDVHATIDGEQVIVDPVIPLTLELLKKIGTNRLELSPGTTDNWTLYNDDDTPLLIFSVRDKNGFAIQLADGAPARRSKGI